MQRKQADNSWRCHCLCSQHLCFCRSVMMS